MKICYDRNHHYQLCTVIQMLTEEERELLRRLVVRRAFDLRERLRIIARVRREVMGHWNYQEEEYISGKVEMEHLDRIFKKLCSYV